MLEPGVGSHTRPFLARDTDMQLRHLAVPREENLPGQSLDQTGGARHVRRRHRNRPGNTLDGLRQRMPARSGAGRYTRQYGTEGSEREKPERNAD